jgi:hypothetical protein
MLGVQWKSTLAGTYLDLQQTREPKYYFGLVWLEHGADMDRHRKDHHPLTV